MPRPRHQTPWRRLQDASGITPPIVKQSIRCRSKPDRQRKTSAEPSAGTARPGVSCASRDDHLLKEKCPNDFFRGDRVGLRIFFFDF